MTFHKILTFFCLGMSAYQSFIGDQQSAIFYISLAAANAAMDNWRLQK